MNLYIRFLKTLLLFLFRPSRQDIYEVSKINFRIWPNDLDTNLHVNNGRYLTLLDLGRLDLLLRNGAGRVLFRERWLPVLASMQVRFRRPLNLFQKIQIQTRIVTWDTKWIYMEQKIFCQKDLVMHAYLKGVFVGPKGSVPVAELLRRLEIKAEPLPLPVALELWLKGEEIMIVEEKMLK